MFSADKTLGANRWPVVRLVPGSQTEIVLLSQQFFCITTHWNRCTVPCSGEDCELCELLPSRGLFYVACHAVSQIRMLELGAQSAAHLEQHCKLLHGGMMPGQVIQLSRRTAKSPVHSEVLRFQNNVQAVSAISLAQRVMALYKFPPPNPTEDLERYEARIRESAKLRNRRMAEQLLTKSKKTGV
jgi:hypothetical protein